MKWIKKIILSEFYLEPCDDTDNNEYRNNKGENDPVNQLIGEDNDNTEDRNDEETTDDVNHSEPLVDGHLLS